MRTTCFLAATAGALGYAPGPDEIMLVNFDASAGKVDHEWRANNDPVMGGQSYSTVAVQNNVLNFTGACKIVPSLKAPGFITAVNYDHDPFVDVSSCEGIKLIHQSDNDYAGFRLSFGTAKAPGGQFFSRGYKANFSPNVGFFGAALLPFKSFTDDWSDSTGKAIKTCADDKIYCPDTKTLKNMETLSIWAEGVEGDIHLEVDSIVGYGCGTTPPPPPPGTGCADTEYCCPDAKACLTPTKTSCLNDANACASGEVCCPLTKLCVKPGKACASPCSTKEFCCPDAKACLTPVNPGVLCSGASDCRRNEVCCPLTNLCVTAGAKCAATSFLAHNNNATSA